MGYGEGEISGPAVSSHVCQFFDSDESRTDSASAFLEPGLWAGEQIIVAARPAHWAAILERFERRKTPIQAALAAGRIRVFDPFETLRKLAPEGRPDACAFREVVVPVVRAAASLGRIRAYGEMVDILAQRGDVDGALVLEAFWNDLAARIPMSLMCAYSAAHFVSPELHDSLRGLCHAHTRVERSVQDPLANWLLMSANNAAGAPH